MQVIRTPEIRTLAQFFESLYSTTLTFTRYKNIPCWLKEHTGYENIILVKGCRMHYIIYASYKNMFLDSEYRL